MNKTNSYKEDGLVTPQGKAAMDYDWQSEDDTVVQENSKVGTKTQGVFGHPVPKSPLRKKPETIHWPQIEIIRELTTFIESGQTTGDKKS